MKKVKYLQRTASNTMLLFLLMFFCSSATQETSVSGIHFFTGTFKEAKIIAQKEGKGIFIDAYTEWCGPCKKMAKTIFTNNKVGTYYNSNYINLKIDMEKGEGTFLSRKYRVTSYPTLIYLNKSGQLIIKHEGAVGVTDFISYGKNAKTN